MALVSLATSLTSVLGDDTQPQPSSEVDQFTVSISGFFHVIYGDPPPGSDLPPVRRYFVSGDEGEHRELILDDELLAAAGETATLSRGEVVVNGWAADSSGGRVEVSAISLQHPIEESESRPVAAGGPVVGSQPYVSILLRFSDFSNTPHPVSWFQDLLLSSYPSIDDYYRENSFNQIDIVGSRVVGWYDLPNPRSYYLYDNDDDGDEDLDFDRAVEDGIAAADDDVYFPNYVGINLMFNQTLDCCSWGGTSDLSLDGQSKIYGVTWLAPWGFDRHDVTAHEMGHAFGLPHSSGPYTATYDSEWDVMSAGGSCTAPDPDYSCLGVHTISYHKDMLGWIPSSRRYSSSPMPEVTTFTLYDLATPAPFWWPTSPMLWYTVEARRFTGYDAELPGIGVLIHSVFPMRERHANVVDADGDGNPNDSGASWEPGETFYDESNAIMLFIESEGPDSSVVTFSNAPRSTVYVDPDHTGYEDGTLENPWNTAAEGYGSAIPHGDVYLAPGNYTETPTLRKAATLRRHGSFGLVTIGQ
jgi:hypothetical protein